MRLHAEDWRKGKKVGGQSLAGGSVTDLARTDLRLAGRVERQRHRFCRLTRIGCRFASESRHEVI